MEEEIMANSLLDMLKSQELKEAKGVLREESDTRALLAGATPLLVGLLGGFKGDSGEIAGNALLAEDKRQLGREQSLFDIMVKRDAAGGKLKAPKPLTRSNVLTIAGPEGKSKIVRVEEALGKSPFRPEKVDEEKKTKTETFKRSTNLRKEYNRLGLTKNTASITQSFTKIQNLAEATQTGANDISLIFAYMKMLDPGSTVREGEQATARNSGAIPDAIKLQYNRLIGGADKILPPETRRNFFKEAGRIYSGQLDLQGQIDTQYSELATRAGLDPVDVLSPLKVEIRDLPEPPPEDLDDDEKDAYKWAVRNKKDPRAKAILESVGVE